MIGYIEDILGFTYVDNPELFIICMMFLMWFIYQFWTFIYYLLGVNK